VNLRATLAKFSEKTDRPAVRAFFLAMAALSVAFVLALYSGAAARIGSLALASATAMSALLLAGWVGITLVPVLAKRTPLRWLTYRMEYRLTNEGWIYIGGIVLVALAAINTGNNLLFLILACLIASILMSGVLSSLTIAGVQMSVALPEHIFVGQTVRGIVEVTNEKQTLPSFSLRVEAAKKRNTPAPVLLETPVYFPYVPRHSSVKQSVPMLFARRGVYRQEAFRIVTRFPFRLFAEGATAGFAFRGVGLSFRRSYRGVPRCVAGNSRSHRDAGKGSRARSLCAARLLADRQRAARSLEGFRAVGFADGEGVCTRG